MGWESSSVPGIVLRRRVRQRIVAADGLVSLDDSVAPLSAAIEHVDTALRTLTEAGVAFATQYGEVIDSLDQPIIQVCEPDVSYTSDSCS